VVRDAVIVVAVAAAGVAAFGTSLVPFKAPSRLIARRATSLGASPDPIGSILEGASSLFRNALSDLLSAGLSESDKSDGLLCDGAVDQSAIGTVKRVAARSERKDGSSRPSSPHYTTQKDPLPEVVLTQSGVLGDYNHYRTVALKSTPDRAVSILTSDVLSSLRAGGAGPYAMVQDGDLGENILVDGVGYRFFEVGKRYQFQRAEVDGDSQFANDGDKEGVVVQITEPVVPCANLCKLPYINAKALEPVDRIKRCQEFLDQLGRADGIRGWYAKVIGSGGKIQPGYKVAAIV